MYVNFATYINTCTIDIFIIIKKKSHITWSYVCLYSYNFHVVGFHVMLVTPSIVHIISHIYQQIQNIKNKITFEAQIPSKYLTPKHHFQGVTNTKVYNTNALILVQRRRVYS